jgi:hypothetical protein
MVRLFKKSNEAKAGRIRVCVDHGDGMHDRENSEAVVAAIDARPKRHLGMELRKQLNKNYCDIKSRMFKALVSFIKGIKLLACRIGYPHPVLFSIPTLQYIVDQLIPDFMGINLKQRARRLHSKVAL